MNNFTVADNPDSLVTMVLAKIRPYLGSLDPTLLRSLVYTLQQFVLTELETYIIIVIRLGVSKHDGGGGLHVFFDVVLVNNW